MLLKMNIKTTILSILGVLAGGYLLLLAVMQISANITHKGMTLLSSSLFPAALHLQESEAAFDRMRKHYGDVIILQDLASLGEAEKEADAADKSLAALKSSLSAAPGLTGKVDSLISRYSDIRRRDHDTYTAVANSKDGATAEVMATMSGLGKENKDLADAMHALDSDIAVAFQTELIKVDAGLSAASSPGSSCSSSPRWDAPEPGGSSSSGSSFRCICSRSESATSLKAKET